MVLSVWALVLALAQFGQANTGELRVSVAGPDGSPVQAAVDVASGANAFHEQFTTDEAGALVVRRLAFGRYQVTVSHVGFAPYTAVVDVHSAVPTPLPVVLAVAPVQAQVNVHADETLIDARSPAPVQRIGREALDTRTTSLPGRVLPDIVATQPGWLLEANGVLHPRGSEYQTQYVVDGLPLTDNRSPAFAPEVAADNAQSVSVITGGYPAEYGRKLGGVVEVVTAEAARLGFHGGASGDAGSFSTAEGSGAAEYGWSRTQAGVTVSGATTNRYLDPPVEANFTNHGVTSGMTARLDHDFSAADRFGALVRYGRASFSVPNELVQQEAGQRQDRHSSETAAEFSYQHLFPSAAADVRGMTRTLGATLGSNAASTPIAAQQDRGFTEGYVKATIAIHAGNHEFKTGGDLSLARARERFAYEITDQDFFGPDVPTSFAFSDIRNDRETALFAQDEMRLGRWTVNAGLRWDLYRFVVDESAVSPRLGVAWSPRSDLVLRASYDRAFQTPASENLLLASSPAVDVLSNRVARLPVRPSRGNFFEGGISKTLPGPLRLDVTAYRRAARNFADDDLLLNTGVSFPIALDRATVAGTEVTLALPQRGGWSGSVAYALMKGTAHLPVTGGLLLGDEADELLQLSEQLPISQDQRHTMHARASYQITHRAWTALAASFGSGLPFEFTGTEADAVAAYGQRIIDRVDFESGRVRPQFTLDASGGVVLRHATAGDVRLQIDVRNLTNRLNVIDFAGLFSGTALGSPRAIAVHVSAAF